MWLNILGRRIEASVLCFLEPGYDINLAFLSPKLSHGIDIVLVCLCPCQFDNPRNTLRWKLLQLASICLQIILFGLRTASMYVTTDHNIWPSQIEMYGTSWGARFWVVVRVCGYVVREMRFTSGGCQGWSNLILVVYQKCDMCTLNARPST
jgi:hypothetical protein